jgi:hypothetical protein
MSATRKKPDTRKNPCQQVQYRSYGRAIQIYHYPHMLLPFSRFEQRLTKAAHGYIKRRISSDPIAHVPRAEGDETPEGFIEVAHLGCVFGAHKGASALAFRIPPKPDTSVGHIEWLCFERGLQGLLGMTIAKSGSNDERMPLFDEVAELEKGKVVKKGTVGDAHLEHRLWFESLQLAIPPAISVTITYKNKRRDMERHYGVSMESQLLAKIEEEKRLSPIRTLDEDDDSTQMERVEKEKSHGILNPTGTRKPVEDVQMQDPEKEDNDEDMEDLDVEPEMADLGIGKGTGSMTPDSIFAAAGKTRVERQAAGEYV